MNIEILKQLGNEWQKGDMHRIYFDPAEFYGLRCEYYNSGKIRKAWLNGEEISNTQGREIEGRFVQSKIWFDVKAEQFDSKNIQPKALARIIENIQTKAA